MRTKTLFTSPTAGEKRIFQCYRAWLVGRLAGSSRVPFPRRPRWPMGRWTGGGRLGRSLIKLWGLRGVEKKRGGDRFCNILFTFEDLREEVGIVLVVERGIATQKNVGDDADAPHVDGFAIRLLSQHLGGNVAGSAARRRHNAALLHFGKTKVADHDLGIFVLRLIKKILRLQVPVYDAHAMHVGHSVQHLCRLKSRLFIVMESKYTLQGGRNRREKELLTDEKTLFVHVKLFPLVLLGE